MAAPFQDMPPPGGYGPVDFQRKAARPYGKNKGMWLLAATLGFTYYSIWLWKKQKKYNNFMEREKIDSKIALQPMLIAEYDRLYLKLFRQNVELEKEVMADVPGWKVGQWFDEPVYYDATKMNMYPKYAELCAHTENRGSKAAFHSRIKHSNGHILQRFMSEDDKK